MKFAVYKIFSTFFFCNKRFCTRQVSKTIVALLNPTLCLSVFVACFLFGKKNCHQDMQAQSQLCKSIASR